MESSWITFGAEGEPVAPLPTLETAVRAALALAGPCDPVGAGRCKSHALAKCPWLALRMAVEPETAAPLPDERTCVMCGGEERARCREHGDTSYPLHPSFAESDCKHSHVFTFVPRPVEVAAPLPSTSEARLTLRSLIEHALGSEMSAMDSEKFAAYMNAGHRAEHEALIVEAWAKYDAAAMAEAQERIDAAVSIAEDAIGFLKVQAEADENPAVKMSLLSVVRHMEQRLSQSRALLAPVEEKP